MIEVLRIAFEECYCGKFRLLDVQIFRLLKLQQRADVIRLRRINDDDALALLELLDDVIAVERGQNGHGSAGAIIIAGSGLPPRSARGRPGDDISGDKSVRDLIAKTKGNYY